MTNKNRKRILPRDKDFSLTGDRLSPYYKRLFRLVRMDDSMPVYKQTELSRELFMGLWGIEKHMLKIVRIQDSLSKGQTIDWERIENAIDYPEPVLLTAYGLLQEKYENRQPVLNEDFLREVHSSIYDAFYIVYPKQLMMIDPKTADDFYMRGNQRIFQSRYDEAIADFNKANEMEPGNPVYEFILAQFWLRYGGDKQRALFWIDKAILHMEEDNPLTQTIFHLLRTTITCALTRYQDAIKSLQTCTDALSFMIEKLTWTNGSASMGDGITIFAEGLRQSLSEAIEGSEHLLALGHCDLLCQVQSILRVQKKLWKDL